MSNQGGRADDRPRRPYFFGTELSGLEHPRDWLRALLGSLAVLGVLALLAFVAFG